MDRASWAIKKDMVHVLDGEPAITRSISANDIAVCSASLHRQRKRILCLLLSFLSKEKVSSHDIYDGNDNNKNRK